jgi:hypothetical protein
MKTKIKKTEVIMKTMKIAMVAILVALAMVSTVNADEFKGKPNKKVVDLTFEQATKIPGLVVAMYQQLNSSFLEDEQPVYTVTVGYREVNIRITGTRDQWIVFFRLKLKDLYDYKRLEIDEN